MPSGVCAPRPIASTDCNMIGFWPDSKHGCLFLLQTWWTRRLWAGQWALGWLLWSWRNWTTALMCWTWSPTPCWTTPTCQGWTTTPAWPKETTPTPTWRTCTTTDSRRARVGVLSCSERLMFRAQWCRFWTWDQQNKDMNNLQWARNRTTLAVGRNTNHVRVRLGVSECQRPLWF